MPQRQTNMTLRVKQEVEQDKKNTKRGREGKVLSSENHIQSTLEARKLGHISPIRELHLCYP